MDVGDYVTSEDPKTGEVASHLVIGVSSHNDPEIEYLRIDGESIETTPNHLFMTDRGWVEAGSLRRGSKLKKLDGSFGVVDGFSIESGHVQMWDLTVSDVHSFAVGVGGFVVHNQGPCSLGTTYPTGTVVPDPGIKITGFQGSLGKDPFHGVNRAIERGVSPQDILNTMRNPVVVLSQSGGRYLYLSRSAGVVVDSGGQVVSVFGAQDMNALNLQILADAIGP
jgi:hypothetical protein